VQQARFRELSLAEASAQSGLSVASLKIGMHRAVRRLRSRLAVAGWAALIFRPVERLFSRPRHRPSLPCRGRAGILAGRGEETAGDGGGGRDSSGLLDVNGRSRTD
jgi:hypothetical protein